LRKGDLKASNKIGTDFYSNTCDDTTIPADVNMVVIYYFLAAGIFYKNDCNEDSNNVTFGKLFINCNLL
jgi:hypothetical protein